MAFVAIASLACSKENPSEQAAQQTQMATLEVNVAEGITTRATSVNDANIGTAERDIQVLVFNSEGDLLAYGANEDSSTKVSLSIPTGTVECYAVVNSYDDLSVIATKTVFLKHLSHLKDNDPTRMEMLGSITKTVAAGTNSVSIAVKRFASKVQIDKITPAFTAPAHRAMEFKLTGIYLINVNGTCPYTMVPTAASESTSWYNKRKYVSGDCNHLITDKFSTPVVMQTAAGVVTPYSKSHYLYCYPNPVTTDVSTTTWSERVSRLVVETTLGGTTYYYSVNIPTPQCNTVYQITNMKITGVGTDTPDAVVQKGSLSVSLTVTDWSTGFSKEVEY